MSKYAKSSCHPEWKLTESRSTSFVSEVEMAQDEVNSFEAELLLETPDQR